MGVRKQGIIVSRNYTPAPDECLRALLLLLKKSVDEKGAGAGARDDVRKEQGAHTTTRKCTQ